MLTIYMEASDVKRLKDLEPSILTHSLMHRVLRAVIYGKEGQLTLPVQVTHKASLEVRFTKSKAPGNGGFLLVHFKGRTYSCTKDIPQNMLP